MKKFNLVTNKVRTLESEIVSLMCFMCCLLHLSEGSLM